MKTILNEGNLHPSANHKGPGDWSVSDFLGESAQASDIRKQLQFLAAEPDAVCILITGETGVGKDLAAKILHSLSVNARDKKNFIHVNCGELHKDHVRSELFGHRKASFTGALEHRNGCFVAAENGTVFLNEIGNIEPDIQSMLLHVLDENKVKPLGSDREVEVNPLVIFATHANLELMSEQGLFRFDLLMRMKCYTLYLPPLRQRKEDIPLIAKHFYAGLCSKSANPVNPVFEKGVAEMLMQLPLKGNVRDLHIALRSAYKNMKSRNENTLCLSHFDNPPQHIDISGLQGLLNGRSLVDALIEILNIYLVQLSLNGKALPDNICILDLPDLIVKVEEVFLRHTNGNKSKAAAMMAHTRKLFYRKLNNHRVIEAGGH